MSITVVVLDEESTFAEALARRLNAEEDLQVVAVVQPTAANVSWHADLILLDGDFAGSIQLCRAASSPPGAPRVIMLSHGSEPLRIMAAMESGARAWVRKDDPIEYLLGVLRGVAAGETWLPPVATGSVLSLLLRQRDEQKERGRLLALLTPRERDVLACLAAGADRRQAAEQLGLTAGTVRAHTRNILTKLGVHSAREAVALTRGWSAPTDEP